MQMVHRGPFWIDKYAPTSPSSAGAGLRGALEYLAKYLFRPELYLDATGRRERIGGDRLLPLLGDEQRRDGHRHTLHHAGF